MIPVGNDGNHLNLAITAPPLNTSVPDSVLQSLYLMSDHLPLICDVEIQTPPVSQAITLDLKVFLEGPFDSVDMRTYLNSILPLSQPYSASPWYYSGTESVPIIPNSDIVDWILVELRDAPQPSVATENTIIATQAAFLLKDGSVVSIDGFSNLQFTISISSGLYVVLRHRNHLSIISSESMIFNNLSTFFDFSTGSDKVYNGSIGYKQIKPGIWGMVSGDSNSDGQINEFDKLSNWNITTGQQGYYSSDYNMNYQITNVDKDDYWLPNLNQSCQIPNN
jgi:hypothetical protein